MGLEGLGLEFGVELHREEEGVVLQLDDLDQVAAGVDARDEQAGALELADVGVVHLVAVAVAFADAFGLVGLGGLRAGGEGALVAAESHGRALVDDLLLLLHHVDHRMGGVGVELGGVGALQLEHVAGELDHGDLQAEAEPVVGHAVLAGVAGGDDLALGAAVAEAAGDEDAVEALEQAGAAAFFQVLGVDAHDLHPGVVRDAGVGDGLVDRFVGVLELDVFADDADFHGMGGVVDAAGELGPDVAGGLGFVQAEEIDHELVEALALEGERELVDRGHVAALDHGLHRHVAEHGQLVAHAGVHRMLAAAHEDVGLDADLAELGHRLLGGLGLQLAGGGEVGHEGDVQENHVARALFEGELAQGLEEGQALDVAGGAADLGDEDVDVLRRHGDALLDLVGHVRDHLHGLAEVGAAALLLDHALVDLAGGEVVEAGKFAAGEALVVTEVEVGLGTVLEDIDLPVLVGAHRARIDVQVGVEFLDAHGEAAHLEQGAERGGGEALAERGDDAAGHKDILHPNRI